jgi:hypothetical protein
LKKWLEIGKVFANEAWTTTVAAAKEGKGDGDGVRKERGGISKDRESAG